MELETAEDLGEAIVPLGIGKKKSLFLNVKLIFS
jgi:hypothetical protein